MAAKKKIRAIGIITGGGDAPGMNAAARAVARAALKAGIKVYGVKKAYKGLVEDEMIKIDEITVSNVINQSGTFLYTDRYRKFEKEEYIKQGIEVCRKHKIDLLVVIGGDGSFRGARDLVALGMPCIGIPATIDNDMASSDYTIGYDTALNTVTEMADMLRATCESHARCDVVEIMGRGAGYLAIESGIAAGATEIVTAEVCPKAADDPVKDPKARSFDTAAADRLCEKMMNIRRVSGNNIYGKRSFIIMVSENMLPVEKTDKNGNKTLVPYGEVLCDHINKKIGIKADGLEETGVETKFFRPAHTQRGGIPTGRDRVIPTMMGTKAVDLMLEGTSNVVIVYVDGKLAAIDLDYAIEMDNLTKGKTTPEKLAAKFTPEQIDAMKARIAKRNEELAYLCSVNDKASV